MLQANFLLLNLSNYDYPMLILDAVSFNEAVAKENIQESDSGRLG